jgi:hypothetical protein
MKYEVTLVVEAPADYSADEVKQMILAGVILSIQQTSHLEQLTLSPTLYGKPLMYSVT